MDNGTTEFPMITAVQPGSSGSPVLVWRRRPARRDSGVSGLSPSRSKHRPKPAFETQNTPYKYLRKLSLCGRITCRDPASPHNVAELCCGRESMRRAVVVLGLAAFAVGASEVARPPVAKAETFRRPNLELAHTTFATLSSDDRIGLHLRLMATGDFNAMASDRLGARLYDAIAGFQQREGLMPTGIPDPVTMARAHLRGDVLLGALRLQAVDVPNAAASLFVPGAFGLVATPTPRGLAYENAERSMSLDVSFFPAADSTMPDIFARLSEARPGRRIDMKVIRDGFFAVAGGGDALGFYSRYIPVAGGTAGFTLAWNTDRYPNGNRIAVLMANGLTASRSQPLPAPPPPPVVPPQQASLEPPASPAPKADPPKPVTVTGSAFIVSSEGDFVTNAHVVKGCASATIPGRGTAHLVAKDAKNDLALLRLDAKPVAPLTPAVFRTTPLQLGEAVYVLGFPYAGALDNGVNFTNGLVSSVAGMDNDTTEFQMTAAVQPGNSGGPVLDGSGALLGVTVARMNDVAALMATNSVPQTVNFGIKGDVAASFLRVNGVEPKTGGAAAVLPTPQIAADGKAFTAQVMCVRVDGAE